MRKSHTSIFSAAKRAIGDRTHLTQKEHPSAAEERGNEDLPGMDTA